MKPEVLAFTYLLEDGVAIAAANTEDSPWDSKAVKSLKDRFKRWHMEVQKKLCCYCRRDFTDEFLFVIDLEHILPKTLYGGCTFDIRNLSISCKRCNMKIKKQDMSFLEDSENLNEDYWSTTQYKFVHPNIDDYESFLLRESHQSGTMRLVFYRVVNGQPKGEFTKAYFKLHQFETDSFDHAQNPDATPDTARLEFFREQVMELERRISSSAHT